MYEFSVETVSFAECRCFLNEDELYRWQNSQADLDTLVLYLETVNGEPRFIRYGKDKKAVYFMGRRKRGVNPDTFQVLNGAFARDDKQVWTLGGVFEVANLATFEVCDSGTNGSHDYGYAKDSKQVYYENFQGKAKVVPKAILPVSCRAATAITVSTKTMFFAAKACCRRPNPKHGGR